MRIAIIGGIGSGKSEVLSVARELGLATLSADEINSQLIETPEYVMHLAEAFPTAVFNEKIDRKMLADIVFSDSNALKQLNAIAHPRILQRIESDKNDPLVVEMPLLVEIGATGLFDEIVLISAPVEKRIERLGGRGMNKDDAESRMRAQADEQSLKAVATQVLDNSAGIEELRKNARELLLKLTGIR